MKKVITCRPCKEQNNWEIENQYGVVLNKHYTTKEACVKAGEELAKTNNCTLNVCDQPKCTE